MKKLFSLLTLALLTMSAWAQTTVTFDLTTGFEDQTELTTLTQGDVTLTFDKGNSTTVPKWYSNGQSARLYAKNTLKIASSGDNITKVTFTFTGTGNTMNNNGTCSVDAGTYVESGTTGTWTGNVDNFTITRGGTSGHARITSIEVVMGGEVVETIADPVITPDDGTTFTESLEVSIACATAGAAIQYSTDGLAWTDYSEPFTITETTKVYARATKGALVSEVVTANYTKIEIPVVDTFVTFNSQNDKGNGTEETAPWTIEKTGVTMACTSGRVYDAGYRIYKDATLTITSTIGNILKIEFDGLSGYAISNLSANVGNLGTNGNNGTWVGEATSVIFTAGAQTRATEIRVYVDGEIPGDFVAAPSIPASTNFDESITVEITNNDAEATVMYNTDGATWQNYTGALTFTETTTLQAKAVKGDNESSVVSATYTKNEAVQTYNTLAEVNALNDSTNFVFGGNAVVTYQNGRYLFLRDATGYGLIYGNNTPAFTSGQVLNQNWSAMRVDYNGLTEYIGAANLSASANTDAELAKPIKVTELSEEIVNAYVEIDNVVSISGTTATLANGSTITLYNRFNIAIPEFENENKTIRGIASIYKGALQLYFIEIVGQETQVVDVNNIAEAIALDEGTQFTMYNDVVVTYHNGSRLFIRDTENNSGLIYGIEEDFANGQVLSDGWTATYQYFNGNTPEFTNPEGVEAAGTETRDAAPFERTTITAANVNEYVILKGVTLEADTIENQFYTADGLQICNFFSGVEIPEVVEGKTYDVTGIVMISKAGVVRVYITELTEVAAAGLRGDVNNDGDVNIGDVTTLIDYLLNSATEINAANADCTLEGDINIGDVTALIDYLLSNAWPE